MKQNLVDSASFLVRAGRGGDGSMHFRREKYVPKGGPDGGKGGDGGSVILRADAHLATLRFFAGKDRFEADNGGPGGKRQRYGDDGENLVLRVPVGTVVSIKPATAKLSAGRRFYGSGYEEIAHSGMRIDTVPYGSVAERWGVDEVEEEWVEVADLTEDGAELVLAQGGRGGNGNVVYKSSTMTTPKFAQRGERGEVYEVRLELKVLADIGLVGLPNAGKSTLLSVLTKAKPEIADYPFTTLSPNLGVLEYGGKQVVVADIPGLIEKAHEGKGLGDVFLKHVERCKALVYVVAPRAEDLELVDEKVLASQMVKQFQTIQAEVEAYGHGLVEKPRLVVLNKTDVLMEEYVTAIKEEFTQTGLEVVVVSAVTKSGMEGLMARLIEL